MRPPLSLVPLLPVMASFIAGIIIWECGLHIIYALIPAVVATLLFLRHKATSAICAMALAIGWINAGVRQPKPLEPAIAHAHNEMTFANALVTEASETETSRHLTIAIAGVGKCRVTMPSIEPAITHGDYVTLTARLEPPQNSHDLPDEWDMESHLRRQGIIATAYIQPEKITVTGCDNSLYWRIRRQQQRLIALLGNSSLNDETTGFLIATVAGDDSRLSPDTRAGFTSSGLAHLLALSGLHVGIIALIIAIILFPLQMAGMRWLRYTITIILLWIYVILTGMSPSVTRAAIMTSIFLLSLILQRRHSAMNALLCAALLILLFDPLSIYSVGFQLSFAAVISILLFANRLNPIHRRHAITHHIVSLATISISAMLGTGIIAAYYFHSFPLNFLFGNILAVAIMPIVIGGGIMIVIAESFGAAPLWLCSSVDFTYGIISSITQIANNMPGANITGIYFPAWLIVPYFATVAALFIAISRRRAAWGIYTIILVTATTVLFTISHRQYPSQEYYITRDTYYTNIIARDSTTLYLFTTSHHSQLSDVLDRTRSKYRDYMGHRSVDSIAIVTDTFSSRIIQRQGCNIFIGHRHFVIASNDNIHPLPDSHPDYTIVCRGFKGDILNLYHTTKPDSILLSNDLHPKRHNRYLQECLSSGIPARSLKRDKR